MSRCFKGRFWILALVLAAGACAETTYSSSDEGGEEVPFLARRVSFKLADAFYRSPPDCITILAAAGVGSPRVARLAERMAARHLSGKIQRVIGPEARLRAERAKALSLGDAGDRKRFAASSRCRYFARVTVQDAGETYLVFWSQRRVQLGLKIFREPDGTAIWRAAHAADRSDGGLPLGPFSMGTAAFSAGRAHGDADALPSLMEDAFRRMLVTLPDTRWGLEE